MRRKPWYLLAILLTAILPLGYQCKPPPPNNEQSDTTRSFHMEYDHMWSYDVFNGLGEDRVRNAFDSAATSLQIQYSNWIEDQVWDYADLDDHVDTYANRVNGLFEDQYYLMGLGEVTGLVPPNQGGITRSHRQPGRARSFIFVHNIRQYYPDYEKMVHKVTIHELGEGRAWLTHLCDGGDMSPDHDLEDCVMAQGRIASCTGSDVTVFLHFCNMCQDKISAQRW